MNTCENCIYWKRNHGEGVEQSNTKFGECKSKKAFVTRNPQLDGSIPQETPTNSVFLDDGGDNLFWIKTGENHSCPHHETSDDKAKKAQYATPGSPESTLSDVSLGEIMNQIAKNHPHPEKITQEQMIEWVNNNISGWEAKKGESGNAIIMEFTPISEVVPGSVSISAEENIDTIEDPELTDDGNGRLLDKEGNHVSSICYNTGKIYNVGQSPKELEEKKKKLLLEIANSINNEMTVVAAVEDGKILRVDGYHINYDWLVEAWEDEDKEFHSELAQVLEDLQRDSEADIVGEIEEYFHENLKRVFGPNYYSFAYHEKHRMFSVNGQPFNLDWCISQYENKSVDLAVAIKLKMRETEREGTEPQRNVAFILLVLGIVFTLGVALSEKILQWFQ